LSPFKVEIAGLLVYAAGLFLPFLVFKENRVAEGIRHTLLEALGFPALLAFVAAGLLLAVTPLLPLEERRKRSVLGIVGTFIVLGVLLAAGLGSRRLQDPAYPYGRVSLGAGTWVTLFGGYLILNAVLARAKTGDAPEDHPGRFLTPVIAAGVVGGTAVLIALGLFRDLSLVEELFSRQGRFFRELKNHLVLAGSAVGFAVAVGIPLGILSYRFPRVEKPVFTVVNAVQTIPSLALFGILIAPLSYLHREFVFFQKLGIRGIGAAPALIALSLYALLPITRNTYTSLKVIDREVIEAGRGMGMNRLKLFRFIELPLSLPVVLSGIRTSSVQAVGNTTVAALIGAGGFGVFVFQGLGQAAPDLILLGAIPVVILAILLDRGLAGFIRIITPKGLQAMRRRGDAQ
jgi:osmoprotectant transport system permease protein